MRIQRYTFIYKKVLGDKNSGEKFENQIYSMVLNPIPKKGGPVGLLMAPLAHPGPS
jgi:hypothetical protein